MDTERLRCSWMAALAGAVGMRKSHEYWLLRLEQDEKKSCDLAEVRATRFRHAN